MAMHMDGGKPQPAAEIKIASTTVDGGYELQALIPCALLALDPAATHIALEMMVSATPTPEITERYAFLFHSIGAYENARAYGRMKVVDR